ncbi:MAG: HAD family phosphatase [Chlamydiales bacterium]
MLKAVLIDFDGTLVDTMPSLYTIYESFMQTNGIQPKQEEFNSLVGLPLNEIIASLIENHRLSIKQSQGEQFFHDELLREYSEQAEIFYGVREVLEAFKEKGLLLAVVTAARKAIVNKMLKRLHLTHYFSAVITPEPGEKGKPDPFLYQKALDTFCIRPDEAVAIEDSANGIQSAQNAGILTHPFSPEKGWDEVKDFVLGRFESRV